MMILTALHERMLAARAALMDTRPASLKKTKTREDVFRKEDIAACVWDY